jgi:hypothetical protein
MTIIGQDRASSKVKRFRNGSISGKCAKNYGSKFQGNGNNGVEFSWLLWTKVDNILRPNI